MKGCCNRYDNYGHQSSDPKYLERNQRERREKENKDFKKNERMYQVKYFKCGKEGHESYVCKTLKPEKADKALNKEKDDLILCKVTGEDSVLMQTKK